MKKLLLYALCAVLLLLKKVSAKKALQDNTVKGTSLLQSLG